MANKEHLAILRQGVEVWNQWREKNSEVVPDLINANLSGTTLRGINFTEANLSGVNARDTKLSSADLSKADLNEADFQDVDLTYANLNEANLIGTNLNGSGLLGASLVKAVLKNALLINTHLCKAHLNKASFTGVSFQGANLSRADLSEADLSRADLNSANLTFANLTGAELSFANLNGLDLHKTILANANLNNANLRRSDLRRVKLRGANFRSADLHKANISEADLRRSDFRNADLSEANFSSVNLCGANLSKANISKSNFRGADLIEVSFEGANLSHVNLSQSQVLRSNFTNATLTGACLSDWQIGSSTILDGVICDYIYRTIDVQNNFTGRLPVDPNSTFASREFIQRFQILASAQETIDITFTDGIDWQAFFISFQELRSQYPNDNISIQGLEHKAEGFIVRLEVSQDADKAAIETQAKQLYATKLHALEAQYERQLRLQGEQHTDEVRQTIAAERQEKATLLGIIKTMAKNQIPKEVNQNFHGPVGNVASTNYGSMSAYVNQHSSDISCLLSSLQQLSQAFPEANQRQVQVYLDDLTTDLQQPEKCQPAKMGIRLNSLFGVLLLLEGGEATATAFADDVLDLAKKLNVPTETFHAQLAQLKQVHPS